MPLVCVIGTTRGDVERLLLNAPVTRCVWRLRDSVEAPVGDVCYAPDDDCEEVREMYLDAGLEVLEYGVEEDDDEAFVEDS